MPESRESASTSWKRRINLAIRRFARQAVNPWMRKIAGRFFFALISHTGRYSGKLYTNPVIAIPNQNGFIIPLPYGADTDWCLNVLSAVCCKVKWNGRWYTCENPNILSTAEEKLPFGKSISTSLLSKFVGKLLYLQINSTKNFI